MRGQHGVTEPVLQPAHCYSLYGLDKADWLSTQIPVFAFINIFSKKRNQSTVKQKKGADLDVSLKTCLQTVLCTVAPSAALSNKQSRLKTSVLTINRLFVRCLQCFQ